MKIPFFAGNINWFFEAPLSQAQEEEIAKLCGVDVYAENITLYEKGISLDIVGDSGKGKFHFEPIGWEKFWNKEKELTGVASCLVWARWQNYVENYNANVAIEGIKRGELGFEDVKLINNRLLRHPRIEKLLSGSVSDGTIKYRLEAKYYRGFKKLTAQEWELYNWAALEYINDSTLSWEGACDNACDNHPELVPSSWIADPGGTLKRKANRYMDKHPLRNQSRSRRNSGDKN